MTRLRSYKTDLFKDLQNRDYAAEYLLACLKETPDTFRIGLGDVITAAVQAERDKLLEVACEDCKRKVLAARPKD